MLNVENYETIQSLNKLVRGVDHPRCCVRCTVSRVIATRPRELVEGQVLSVIAHLPADNAGLQGGGMAPLRVQFYDQWAYGASFVEVGDTLILAGIQVHALPSPAGEGQQFYVTPLREGGTLRVVQRGPSDFLEVTVTPTSFDNPAVKVVHQHESAPKNCYVNRRT